jgi:uncharacterized protein
MHDIAGDANAPMARRFRSAVGEHLLVIPFSRLFDLSGNDPESFDDDSEFGSTLIAALAKPSGDEASLEQVPEPNPQNLSLNVSSTCNLSCGYCYAARGSFGGAQPATMQWPTARAAIDRLLTQAERARPVTIGFLGGEPFANRPLIHRCVEYAVSEAARLHFDIRFSVTTNGTLLRPSDVELLRRHPFAVTVSLDGGAQVHDAQRPRFADGAASWPLAVSRLAGLLDTPGLARLNARATVTRHNMDLRERLEAIASLGFADIGFSPLRVGPASAGPLTGEDWRVYLSAMIDVARLEIERAKRGLSVRLGNLTVALRQIHAGASTPYPCGAGGGYFSVAADGRWYACHRAIGDKAYELGSNAGLDHARRRAFIAARHVHAQTDCRSCWARYLCAGGCHQEAAARTASSCDFIRGWLDFCLKTYCELGPTLLRAGEARTHIAAGDLHHDSGTTR